MEDIQIDIEALTEDEWKSLISSIEDLSASIYRTDMSIEDKIDNYLGQRDRELLTIFLNTGEFDHQKDRHIPNLGIDLLEELKGNSESVVEKLTKLVIYLKDLPQAKFKIAFDPTTRVVNDFRDYLKTISKERLVMRFEIDHTIIAGFKLEYGGKYLDYSYQEVVDKIMANI